MNERETEAYLKRIGYEDEIKTDRNCLEKLMEHQLCSIPFENLESFEEGKVPSLESCDIFEKIIIRKRGGYCFELNKLFYEFLGKLGFQVMPVAVRILWKKEKLPPMLHRATIVTLPDGIYYCDVGYGGPGPRRPVKLKDGVHKERDGEFRITMKPENTNGEVLVERRTDEEFLPLLRFALIPALEADFEIMNYYCAKAPNVLFTQKRVVSICEPEGSVALTGDVLTIQKEDGSIETKVSESEETVQIWMRFYFGLEY